MTFAKSKSTRSTRHSRRGRRSDVKADKPIILYAEPAKTCVKVAATKHYFLHYNTKTGKFFYKGKNFSAQEIVEIWRGRQDNHAVLFSAIAYQWLDCMGIPYEDTSTSPIPETVAILGGENLDNTLKAVGVDLCGADDDSAMPLAIAQAEAQA